MKILSIDIGIKNLAYIVLESNNNNFNIIKWDVINLCNTISNCSSCIKTAKFCKNDNFFCNIHSKKSEYKIPTIDTKNIHKQSFKNITLIANDHNINYDKNINKNELIELIKKCFEKDYLEPVLKVNANDIKLIDLGINLRTEFNKLFSYNDIESFDIILLENQISPIANRMKTIQGMLAQYFIDNGNYNIEFISASNKLKILNDNKKTTYNERKKLSVEFTKNLLIKNNLDSNLEFFCENKKKDDLSDCFLQGIYYLNLYNKIIL
tara:strand:- start:2273 stop:3070 length:798 start_codon:yes stop_codon:yes gene_type:complete